MSQAAGSKLSFFLNYCYTSVTQLGLSIYITINCLIMISCFLTLADCVLFFGCRNSNKDFFFKEEWQPLVENGSLQLFTAFSRDQVISYYPTVSVIVQNARDTSTNIPRYCTVCYCTVPCARSSCYTCSFLSSY